MKMIYVSQRGRHQRSQTISGTSTNNINYPIQGMMNGTVPNTAISVQQRDHKKTSSSGGNIDSEAGIGLGLPLEPRSHTDEDSFAPRSSADLGSPIVPRPRPVSQISAFSQLSAFSVNSNVSSTGSLNSIDRMHPRDIVSKLRRPPMDRASTNSSMSSGVSHKAHRKSSSLASASEGSPGSSPRSPRHHSPATRFHSHTHHSPFGGRFHSRGRFNEAAVFSTNRARSRSRRLTRLHSSEQKEPIREDEEDLGTPIGSPE
jgi:hypothetical protein